MRTQSNSEDGSTSGDGAGPTALRRRVGADLRRLREERGISRAGAGKPIRASESKISRMELGRVGFKPRDVEDLLSLYGVHDERERAEFLARVQQANAQAWWRAYADVTPAWFQDYLGLEAAASLIRTYQVQFVPGLLQTEAYARAVVRLGHSNAPEEEIDRRVRLRMTRQERLTGPHPCRLWAVVDEAVLRRPIGGTAVLRDQLEALIGVVTKRSNVQLQVVPLAAGGHAAAGGSFTILRFVREELPDVVYLEQLTTAQYLDRREHVDHYAETVDRLAVDARPVTETVDILDQILHDLL